MSGYPYNDEQFAFEANRRFKERQENKMAAPLTLDGMMHMTGNIYKRPYGTHTFEVWRGNDESGVSGTGLVLRGCIFPDGVVTVRWCTGTAPPSTVVYGLEDKTDGWEKFLSIHVQPHPTNSTQIIFFPQDGRDCYDWVQPAAQTEQQPETEDEDPNGLEELAKAVYQKYLEIARRKGYI